MCKEPQQSQAFVGNPSQRSVACQRPVPRIKMLSAFAATAGSAKNNNKNLSQSDEERLLMGQIAMTAFIVAEMRHFVNTTMLDYDTGRRYDKYKWQMPIHEKIQMKLVDIVDPMRTSNETPTAMPNNEEEDSPTVTVVPTREYADMILKFQGTSGGNLAVNLICNTAEAAFGQGLEEEGLMSALGCAILFFRNFFRATPEHVAACERIGYVRYICTFFFILSKQPKHHN
jgi:hypothetical protein